MKEFPPHPDGNPKRKRDFLYLNNLHGGPFTVNGSLLSNHLVVDETRNDLATIGFDSDATYLADNAKAIAWVLTELKRCGRQATIVSHSKGGQDVLHALSGIAGTLDSLGDLEQADSKAAFCGAYTDAYLAERQRLPGGKLWNTVSGWVAFTSNHMESGFTVNDTGAPPEPPKCSINNIFPVEDCNLTDASNVCPDSRDDFWLTPCRVYENILKEPCGPAGNKDCWLEPTADQSLYAFIGRLNYMHDNRRNINNLLSAVTVASLYARYNPGTHFTNTVGEADILNRGMRNDAEVIFGTDKGCGAGHNDGILPTRAGQLFGADILEEPLDDPDSGSNACGVDHFAPVVDVQPAGHDQWRPIWRNQQTEDYIDRVEAVEREAVLAAARRVPGFDCFLDAPDNLLDASPSVGVGLARDFRSYEWFENGELIATGAKPGLFFDEGRHDVTPRVTAGCIGLSDETFVSFTLGGDCP